MKRLVPQLKKLSKDYPMKTLDNVIRNIDSRIEFYQQHKRAKK